MVRRHPSTTDGFDWYSKQSNIKRAARGTAGSSTAQTTAEESVSADEVVSVHLKGNLSVDELYDALMFLAGKMHDITIDACRKSAEEEHGHRFTLFPIDSSILNWLVILTEEVRDFCMTWMPKSLRKFDGFRRGREVEDEVRFLLTILAMIFDGLAKVERDVETNALIVEPTRRFYFLEGKPEKALRGHWSKEYSAWLKPTSE